MTRVIVDNNLIFNHDSTVSVVMSRRQIYAYADYMIQMFLNKDPFIRNAGLKALEVFI